MATVTGKTSIKIDDLVNDTVISGSVDGTGHLILVTRGGAQIDAGYVGSGGTTGHIEAWYYANSYVIGDVVGYAGMIWKAKGPSTGKAPILSMSLWQRLTGDSADDWAEKDPYFLGDQNIDAWEFFWKNGNPLVTLTKVAGEFETGIQALKIAMVGGENQRFYQKEENFVRGGETIVTKVRARLSAPAAGAYLAGNLIQNDDVAPPAPFMSGNAIAAANEGNQILTTSWATYTFTYTAANAKPRASANLIAVAPTGVASTFLIDSVRTTKSYGATAGASGNTFTQGTPATVWTINHTLPFQPNVVVVDSAGSQVEGDVKYVSATSITVTFSAAFSGTAYLS